MHTSALLVLAVIACAYATPTTLVRRDLGCDSTDKTGLAFTSAKFVPDDVGGATDTECIYGNQNACTYFANGNFSSGSSDCPSGLVQGGAVPPGGSSTSASASASASATSSGAGSTSSIATSNDATSATGSTSASSTDSPSNSASDHTSSTGEATTTTGSSSVDATQSASSVSSASASQANAALPGVRGSAWALTVGAVLIGVIAS